MDYNSTVTEFNKIYRDSNVWEDQTRWMGIPIDKYPTDLWLLQEIIFTIKPDLIIETKTGLGSNSLYMASLLDIINNGHIISIDKEQLKLFKHKRITYLQSNPLDSKLLDHLNEISSNHKIIMVILNDSVDPEIVYEELNHYYDFVTIGSYLIVENTCIDIDYVETNIEGPMQAVDTFLYGNLQFIVDSTKDKFLLSSNPNGYLVRMIWQTIQLLFIMLIRMNY